MNYVLTNRRLSLVIIGEGNFRAKQRFVVGFISQAAIILGFWANVKAS